MQIFEYPYVIITIFVFCFIILAAIGIYFAIRGMKVANDGTENDFTTVSKMESAFKNFGKSRANRCVMYISVSSDNSSGLNSEPNVFSEIKTILLNNFSNKENSQISLYDDKNYIVLSNFTTKIAQEKVENFQNELNKCLLKYSLLNVLNIRVGSYFATGIQVTFDQAINRAKQASILAKNEQLFYVKWDINCGKMIENKIKRENSIEKEIDNNRFFLEYQPVIDAKTRQIIGAEVLSRLNSESDGVLTPVSFLSAVDSVGISEKFDYYIFEKNCKWISNNKEKRENYKYTINFSRSTLCEEDFAKNIINIAQKYNLKLSCLAVEILEDKSIVGDAKKQMIQNLATLKNKGVDILLDDFGSGYTTFDDLNTLDISVVKIDKKITQNAVTEPGFIILKNIISTTKGLGYKTLCEGIETKSQEEAAIKAGTDLLQGYYYYRPMPVTMLEKVLEEV